jgi:hypothetical protein
MLPAIHSGNLETCTALFDCSVILSCAQTGCYGLFAAASDPSLLPPNKSSRLVGCVSVSFDASSRDSFESLEPPSDEPYLSNMAVDVKVRRWAIFSIVQHCLSL